MFKKTFIIGGGVLLLLALIFGQRAYSYVSTAVNQVRTTVEDQIPMEFELNRIKNEISKLDGDLENYTKEIIVQEVAIERLQQEISDAELVLNKDKQYIMRLKAALDTGETTFKFVSTEPTYTATDVERNLKNKFDSFKTRNEANDVDKARLEKERDFLAAINEQHDKTVAEKERLEGEAAGMESKLKLIEVAEISNRNVPNNSRLGKIRHDLEALKARIEVKARMSTPKDPPSSEIKLDEPVERNISAEITDFFTPGESEYVKSVE